MRKKDIHPGKSVELTALVGFEPMTLCILGGYSTNEATREVQLAEVYRARQLT